VDKRPFNLPPSAELHYAISAKQSGLDLKGEGLVKWTQSKTAYSVNTETRAMLLGKILETSSEGSIDAYGLAPSRFVESACAANRPPPPSIANRTRSPSPNRPKASRCRAASRTVPASPGSSWRLPVPMPPR
jgi:hypothetical protein